MAYIIGICLFRALSGNLKTGPEIELEILTAHKY